MELRKKIKQLENTMQKITDQQTQIDQQLSDNNIYSDDNKQPLKKLLIEKAELEKSHESAEFDWLEANEELEKIEM